MSDHSKVDEKIMDELLNTPKVKAETQYMTPETLSWYRDLLVSEGIYDRYVKERGRHAYES